MTSDRSVVKMELHDLYMGCRTYRKFQQKEIPADVYSSILNNLRITHTGNNRQLLRFVIIQSEKKRKEMDSLVHFAALLPRETADPKPDEEPMGYIVITQPDPKGVTDIDAGIAAQVICCSAWEKGVGSCIMMNFDHEKTEQLIGISEGRKAVLVVALGYPAHQSTITDVGADGSLKYHVDTEDNNHYYVPKLPVKDLCRFL